MKPTRKKLKLMDRSANKDLASNSQKMAPAKSTGIAEDINMVIDQCHEYLILIWNRASRV